ncbi:MAG: amidohydrolase family protein [Candidatus Glassbacteria bacterium]|nr:amidohydrolase family protein [Candidatus Glassbacteria bacterium]
MPDQTAGEAVADLAKITGRSGGDAAETAGQPQGGPLWLAKIPKIDAHAHIDVEAGTELLCEMLEAENMKWLAVCYDGLQWETLENRIRLAGKLHAEFPGRISWATSFKLNNWGSPAWASESIDLIADSFEKGAVAVKVWKDIGMALKDPDDSYVMIDDERFDPVFDFVRSRDKTLVGHVIEPLSCWQPLESMALNNDREYYRDHPREHAYRNPGMLKQARYLESMKLLLERHPGLRIVLCHLAGLESDLEALAGLLDEHSNLAVDTAARVGHLQALDREKVRAFLIKYQDRLLYGTDLEIAVGDPAETGRKLVQAAGTYERDRLYFSTDREITVPELDCPVRGLELPAQVLQKLYFDNALHWYPGI